MARIPDLGWSDDFERGYEAALVGIKVELEREYHLTQPEDVHYAYYIKHVIDIVNQKLNPLIREWDNGQA